MTQPPPAKPPRTAADVAAPLGLSDPAKLKLAPGQTARQYFDALAADPALADDGIRFLAAALPKREAVGWALTCVREVVPPPLPEPAVAALAAAERWLKDPSSDAHRRAAGAAADTAGIGTPAGCLAAAAFYSGGSLAPPDLPPVPPRDDLTALAVAGSLALAAVADPPKADAARARFLAVGKMVAAGQMRF